MVGCSKTVGAKPQAAEMLEVLDHLFRRILVLADDQVDVVEEDRTRVAGVIAAPDRFTETCADAGDRIAAHVEQRKLQQRLGALIECANLATGGLDSLATVVKVTDFFEKVAEDDARAAAARIVGKPPTV
jgi:hypothetical protein